MPLLPGVWGGSYTSKCWFSAASIGPSVSAAAGTEGAAAAWTQARELGAEGNVSGLRQCPCVSETASPPRVQARGCLWGLSSSRCRPDPIPSLALCHFSLALSQGCCPHRALAAGAALTCHCRAARGLPHGAWKRLCAILARVELDPARAQEPSVFPGACRHPLQPGLAKDGLAGAARSPAIAGDVEQMWPCLAGLSQLCCLHHVCLFLAPGSCRVCTGRAFLTHHWSGGSRARGRSISSVC